MIWVEGSVFLLPMSVLTRYFSPSDLEEIKSAVGEAESKTAAEIVPFFAESSHHYREWAWFGAFLMGGLTGISFYTAQKTYGLVWGNESMFAVLSVWAGAVVGLGLFFLFPKLRILLVPKNSKQYFVELRAKEAFLDEEVFRTKNRTGILIYISLFEHFVRVYPDKEIARVVPKSEWNEAVRLIIEGMKSGKKKQGIVASILFCGDLLKKYNIHAEKDDKNEISNEIRDGGKLM
ncbi:PF04536 family protein [Leptospira yanagawae serovar Saopaulo str. Sao Paulo = ATCC 700523]|uniref:PF04536 family protein n=2 Tax=Leptospira yanagawae TaxID=293069 RepID=A0A5E8HD22_9LEPT|nr:PF04536 family protein [Leptospira yanagawae serovar Saopaulo str. Sao Paulo = ATCC 700523]